MATKKEYEIKVDTKIEPVTQFVKVVESANKSTKDWGEKLKDVIEKEKELSKEEKEIYNRMIAGSKVVDEIHRANSSHEQSRIENAAKMLVKSKEVSAAVMEINDYNQKTYKLLQKNNQEKMVAIQSEIDGLAKNAKSLEVVTKAYEKKKQVIEEQAAIALAEAEATYNVQIKQAKEAGKDTVSIETAKTEQIKLINEQLNKDLKKNSEDYTASHKAVYGKMVASLSADAEIYVDTTSKKTKKLMKAAAADAAEMLGINEETAQGIIKSAVTAAEKAKAATTEVKKTGEEATKTGEATKKIIDIDATEGRIRAIKFALNDYQSVLKDEAQKTIKRYDEEIKAAGDNVEKRKELEARKAQVIKDFTEEIWKLNQDRNTIEEKAQGLNLVQWQQYADKFKTITGSINSVVQQIGNSIKGVFSTITAGIDDEIKEIDDKTKEADIIIAEKNEEKNKLEAEKLTKKIALAEDSKKLSEEELKTATDNYNKEIAELGEKIDKEDEIIKKETANKNKYDAEKKKKEQEKRKLEKAQRKIDLGMQITSGIANVAEGVTKALAKGPIIGQILAAIQAAQGAVQVAIMTKQLANLEDGGLLKGKRHSQGGMRIEGSNIEVEGGEYVINRESTGKNLGLIRYINTERKQLTPADINTFFASKAQSFEPSFRRAFEQGGQLPMIETPANIDNDSLIKAIQSIKIEPKVAVTDIHKVQDSMVSVDGWAGV